MQVRDKAGMPIKEGDTVAVARDVLLDALAVAKVKSINVLGARPVVVVTVEAPIFIDPRDGCLVTGLKLAAEIPDENKSSIVTASA